MGLGNTVGICFVHMGGRVECGRESEILPPDSRQREARRQGMQGGGVEGHKKVEVGVDGRKVVKVGMDGRKV